MTDNLKAQLTTIAIELSDCKRDLEQMIGNDAAKALQSMAKLHQHILAVQVLSSHLMMDAERLIVKSSPPQRWWRKDVVSSGPQIVSSRELKKMRRIHNQISDKVYEKLKKRSLEKQIPLTRESLLRVIQQNAAVLGATAAAASSAVSGI